MDLISIVTPIKNGDELFHSTYHSVIQQSYTRFEWIIVDDGSNEDQIDKIKGIINDDRVLYIIGNNNLGPGGARNIGLKNISGKYVSFIDSDDLWDIDFLQVCYNSIKRDNRGFVFSGYRRYIIELENYLEDFIPCRIINSNDILKGSDISCLTAMIKTDFLDDTTLFGEIPARNDLVFFFRVLLKTPAIPISETLATYRLKKNSVSSNKIRAMKYQFHVNRRYANKNLLESIINVCIWIIYGLKKYRK